MSTEIEQLRSIVIEALSHVATLASAVRALETKHATAAEAFQDATTANMELYALALNQSAIAAASSQACVAAITGGDAREAFEGSKLKFKSSQPLYFRASLWGERPDWLSKVMGRASPNVQA